MPWLDDSLPSKRKIMDCGLRVDKHGDSRVPTTKAELDSLIEHSDRVERPHECAPEGQLRVPAQTQLSLRRATTERRPH